MSSLVPYHYFYLLLGPLQESKDEMEHQYEASLVQLKHLLQQEQGRAEGATAAADSLQAQAMHLRQTADVANQEAKQVRQQVHDLQAELEKLRSSNGGNSLGSMLGLPSKQDFLEGLGIEGWSDQTSAKWRPTLSGDDIESTPSKAYPKAGKLRSSLKRLSQKHRISHRAWLVAAYLIVVHLALMISFTRQTPRLEGCSGLATVHSASAAAGAAFQDTRLP